MVHETPTTSDPTAFAERFVEEIWNGRDLSLIDEMVAPEYVGHWFAVDERATDVDREGLREFVTAIHEGFSDFRMDVEFTLQQDDMVAVGFTSGGTHDGEFMDIPATDRQGSSPGIFVNRIEDGRVVEAWAVWDALGLLQQMGVVPETFTLSSFLETGARLAKQDILKRAKRD